MKVIAQETTTLPEGAVVTIMKCEQARKDGMSRYTALHVYRGEKELEMRMDDVSASNLRQYFDMVVREINRRRQAMTAKPAFVDPGKPALAQFIDRMALSDMFMFDAVNPVIESDLKPEKPKRRRKEKKEVTAETILSVFPHAVEKNGSPISPF